MSVVGQIRLGRKPPTPARYPQRWAPMSVAPKCFMKPSVAIDAYKPPRRDT